MPSPATPIHIAPCYAGRAWPNVLPPARRSIQVPLPASTTRPSSKLSIPRCDAGVFNIRSRARGLRDSLPMLLGRQWRPGLASPSPGRPPSPGHGIQLSIGCAGQSKGVPIRSGLRSGTIQYCRCPPERASLCGIPALPTPVAFWRLCAGARQIHACDRQEWRDGRPAYSIAQIASIRYGKVGLEGCERCRSQERDPARRRAAWSGSAIDRSDGGKAFGPICRPTTGASRSPGTANGTSASVNNGLSGRPPGE
jgi:hypothetical protein